MSIPTSAALSPSLILSELEANPYVLLAFAVPIIVIIASSIAMTVGKSKARYDAVPTLAQSKEQFKVPASPFNREMKYVEDEDISHFINAIQTDMGKIQDVMKKYERLIKLYKRLDLKSKSISERRAEKAKEKRELVFKDIVEIYRYIEKLKTKGFAYGDKGKQA